MRNQLKVSEPFGCPRFGPKPRCWMILLGILFMLGCTQSTAPSSDSDETKKTIPVDPPAVAVPTVPGPSTTIHFTDVAIASGINWTVHNGEESGNKSVPETLGAGCATIDYDRDGQIDILILGGGNYSPERELQSLPMALFRQSEPWHFEAVQSFARLPTPQFYHHGAFTADFDNDGFADLLMTGYGGLQLFHNRGDGTFIDVTSGSGLVDTLWSTAAAWADLNEDGILDLFVGHYVNWSLDNDPACTNIVGGARIVCSPTRFNGLPSSAFLGNGDGSFHDISREVGLDLVGKTLGVVIADLDNDGSQEIYVANDTVPNQLYQRQADHRYRDIGLTSGVALGDTGKADGSMGVDVGDIDGDDRLDIWVANYEDESFALYRNVGNLMFDHASRAWGIAAVGRLAVGFGTVIFDADSDGYPDIFCTNGHLFVGDNIEAQKQQPYLFHNQRGKRLRNIAGSAGTYLEERHLGRGAACADLDQNGALDLVITHTNAPAALLRNDTPIANYLNVRLIGTESNRDAIGARVTILCGGKPQVMVVKGGGSYLSTSDRSIYFGLGDNSFVDRIEIVWPRGKKQIVEGIRSQQTLQLVER